MITAVGPPDWPRIAFPFNPLMLVVSGKTWALLDGNHGRVYPMEGKKRDGWFHERSREAQEPDSTQEYREYGEAVEIVPMPLYTL